MEIHLVFIIPFLQWHCVFIENWVLDKQQQQQLRSIWKQRVMQNNYLHWKHRCLIFKSRDFERPVTLQKSLCTARKRWTHCNLLFLCCKTVLHLLFLCCKTVFNLLFYVAKKSSICCFTLQKSLCTARKWWTHCNLLFLCCKTVFHLLFLCCKTVFHMLFLRCKKVFVQ
jgi:hypothetical protein